MKNSMVAILAMAFATFGLGAFAQDGFTVKGGFTVRGLADSDLGLPAAVSQHCVTPTIKAFVDASEKAVECINAWQREYEANDFAEALGGGLQTATIRAALSASIGIAVAKFGQLNAPDDQCAATFQAEVAKRRSTYDESPAKRVHERMHDRVSLESHYINELNELIAGCKVDRRFLGEIAEHGVKPSPTTGE